MLNGEGGIFNWGSRDRGKESLGGGEIARTRLAPRHRMAGDDVSPGQVRVEVCGVRGNVG